MAISKEKREKAEALIYQVFDAIDPSGNNTEYYKEAFNNMSNSKFEELFKKKFPLKYHHKPFETEPKFSDLEKGANIIGIPLLEEVREPHVGVDENGNAVKTKECLVGYVHLRKEQQFLTKKNSMSIDITNRDMKTGLLLSYDKNGNTTDRENESLITLGLLKTSEEFSGPRADSMESKNAMYSTINTLGVVSLDDLPMQEEESIALNLFNNYLLGAHIESNILNKDYLLPHTLKNRRRIVDRG